jgi:hypothetical protein
MKSIKLKAGSLDIAKRMHEATEKHMAVHKAFHERVGRQEQTLREDADREMRSLFDLLMGTLSLSLDNLSEPQLDLRYVEEHGEAFLIYTDADELELETAPGEH